MRTTEALRQKKNSSRLFETSLREDAIQGAYYYSGIIKRCKREAGLLLDCADIDINSIGINGRIALSEAVFRNNEGAVKLLLERDSIEVNWEENH